MNENKTKIQVLRGEKPFATLFSCIFNLQTGKGVRKEILFVARFSHPSHQVEHADASRFLSWS